MIRFCQICFAVVTVVLLLPLQGAAADQQTYCAGVYQCLGEQGRSCTETMYEKKPGVSYDNEFCSVFKELKQRGLETDSYWGRRMHAHLSQKYRVTYELTGTLPLSVVSLPRGTERAHAALGVVCSGSAQSEIASRQGEAGPHRFPGYPNIPLPRSQTPVGPHRP